MLVPLRSSYSVSYTHLVFYGWGGINAKQENTDCDFFFFKDINPIFDYYTPVIIANNTFLQEHPDIAKKFMEATQKGYEYAVQNPVDAANMLIAGDNTGSLKGSEELVQASQQYISDQYIACLLYTSQFCTQSSDRCTGTSHTRDQYQVDCKINHRSNDF